MKKKTSKLPGKGIRILSFIPVFNCFALIYIGLASGNLVYSICGIAYFLVSIAIPEISFFLWIACIIHYFIAYKRLKKQMVNFEVPPTSTKPSASNTTVRNETSFSDVTLSGAEEIKQSIPVTPSCDFPPLTVSFSYESSQGNFFKDMKKYENKSGIAVPFEPFMVYWPTYEAMSKGQSCWYFYWRTEVRKQNYIDTDLSYVFIYIYELLSGIGWKYPQEGYDRLTELWQAYQQRLPKLARYLHIWTFDFAYLHNLEHTKTVKYDYFRLAPSARIDLQIEQHRNDAPLKLPFDLINALCSYSLIGSKFYKDGNQLLMQNAIPRVVALVDAVLRKQNSKGILDVYGPNQNKRQEYYAFTGAVCPKANEKIYVSVKTYSSNEKLREYINELVRHAENTLRSIYAYRGRLRGVSLDEKTAAIVDAFLKKEYANVKPSQPESKKKIAANLDFSNIDTLRKQSNAVRSALEVDEISKVEEKELLTDVAEVTAVFIALSSGTRIFLDRLHDFSWKCKKEPTDEAAISEINRLAEHYLGIPMIAVEKETIIAEDDYRDELDFIYQNPPQVTNAEECQDGFNLDCLNKPLKEFISQLMSEQLKALHCIVMQDDTQQQLEQISEEAMTMPQLLVDDINCIALQTLGDIIIDPELRLMKEYETELKISTR
ncbi:MAG: TerB N-terminal domain-containing protein [Peptostreptococcaceae bacterium]|nr:TerB N-terminal domain-containing protein [Peptostreptococcaceae bacterium]